MQFNYADKLSPWISVDANPVRVGWYLVDNDDHGLAQSGNAPDFTFEGTVWRYWDGKKWMWFAREVVWDDKTDKPIKGPAWHTATLWKKSHWRGLIETFGFKPA